MKDDMTFHVTIRVHGVKNLQRLIDKGRGVKVVSGGKTDIQAGGEYYKIKAQHLIQGHVIDIATITPSDKEGI